MSTLMPVLTTVKLCRFCPSFFTMKGRFRRMDGGSLGWMSWKWLSTATETYGPVVDGGVVTTTMGRRENGGDEPEEGFEEQAWSNTAATATARDPRRKRTR